MQVIVQKMQGIVLNNGSHDPKIEVTGKKMQVVVQKPSKWTTKNCKP